MNSLLFILAAVPAVDVPAATGGWITIVLTALAPILAALIGWLGVKIAAWITQATSNEMLKGVLTRLDTAVFNVVKETMMTTIDAAKAADANGQLPAAVGVAAKDAALVKIKSYLGVEGWKQLMLVLGLDDAQAASYVATKLEATVHSVKTEATAAASGDTAATALAAIVANQ
jgi:hypothetical protein